MLIMTQEGELKTIFLDYLLVTQHTGHALVREIYEETSVKKSGLSPEKIIDYCTRVTFDGQYFNLYAPEALAKIAIERAKKQ